MLRWASASLCLCLLSLAETQLLDLYEGDTCKEADGKLWTCKRAENCPKAREQLLKGIRPTTCSFIKNFPLVCCEPEEKKPASVGIKSRQMCKKYGESVYYEVQDPFTGEITKSPSCTVVEPLISGGKNAQPREYPHMALIGYGQKKNIQWKCGGSLISERYILSAAHCTDAGSQGKARWARLGEYNIKSTKDDEEGDAQPENHEIIQTINHPKYTSVLYNDIALYKLKDKVTFNEYIRPICLQTNHQFSRGYFIATGWGRTEQQGPASAILQKVNVTITPRTKCLEYYKAEGNLKYGLDDTTMICAGNLINNGRVSGDTCKGDSGGPLQVPLKDPYCMYSQIGVTSFGGACGINRPAVYTRVSRFIEWIEGIVWP